MTDSLELSLQQACKWLNEADGLLITAGAGMGVDSGLPDFRGNEGFWNAYPALGKQHLSFTDIANASNFASAPQLAWGFYGHRLQLYRNTEPHAGFQILRNWSNRFSQGAFVVTSNVDGQFQRAGFDPNRIVEIHGSIHHLQCLLPCSDNIWSANALQPQVDADSCLLRTPLPRCPACDGIARPNILMFDDWHWLDHRTEQQRAHLKEWLERTRQPLVIELGAGQAIPSIRRYGERFGWAVIRINPRDAEANTHNQIALPMTALQGLQAIAAKLATISG